jgi:hypothetical protein
LVSGKWQVRYVDEVRSCSLVDGRKEMVWENVLVAGWMDGWMDGWMLRGSWVCKRNCSTW